MIAMICVDDKGGTMFNHRRQSKDRVLRAEMLRLAGEHRLKVSPYTARQFEPEEQAALDVSENFLAEAGAEDFCFVEEMPLAPWEDQIQTLILFRWNRVYPADAHLDIPLAEHGWKLTESRDFAGSSHETITQEVYIR